MKKVLLTLAAVATLAACSTEKTMDFAKDAIAFDNAFVDNATKSVVDPSYTNKNMFSDFQVFAFVEGASLFGDEGKLVAKNIRNGELLNSDWKYEGTQYWIAGAKYNFSAVAPSTGWTKTAATKDGVTLSFTNNGITDILFAQTAEIEGKVSGNPMVAFTFRHILSKVKFSFENAYNASAATIKVYDIKLLNAHATGNVKLTSGDPVWSNQAGTLELAFGMATDNETTDAKEDIEVAYAYGNTYESQKELLLIPGAEDTEYNVTFNVDLLVSGQFIKTYNHKAKVKFAPAPGTCYDIKAVVNAENIDPDHAQEPIEFTVTKITDWIQGADQTANIQKNPNSNN